MDPTELLVLPAEVDVFPVETLDPPVRAAIGCDPDDYAVTRRRSRRTTRVVDSAAADLIQEFRRPSNAVEAIRRYTGRAGLNPKEVLDTCVPFLNEMINDGFIVRVGADEQRADDRQLRVGSRVGDWEVLEPIQLLEDTEVYRVQSADGEEAALKRVLDGSDAWIAAALRNELRMLERLDGAACPVVLEDGTEADQPHLVISWCEGEPVTSAASRLRRPWSADSRRALAELCVAILDAYVALHALGVLHGDVHPRNLLFESQANTVRIVDFGFALIPSDTEGRRGPSGGVEVFFAPEYAAASLARRSTPAPTPASEQYSLAALLYKLITGEHYLQRELESRRWLEAVCNRAPRGFSTLAIPSSPELEAVLAQALAKDPEERFDSMAEFRDRFSKAAASDLKPLQPASAPASWTPPGLFPALSARLGIGCDADQLLSSPTATVNYGSAGIAYLFYRAGCALDRPDLLSLADVWIERAKRALADTPFDACFDRKVGLDPQTIGDAGLYHSAVGVHCVDALIACASALQLRAETAVDRFVAAAKSSDARQDLVTGRAGQLLGCVSVLEAVRAAGYGEQRLVALGRELHGELLQQLDSPKGFFGVAHGWAGILYATLRFDSLTYAETAPRAIATLEELASRALVQDGRASWPRGPEDEVVWPGWCHGSAGYTMLWAQAHRVLSDNRYLELARMAAEHAWSEPATSGQLCCGTAGQAYGFLCLHRLTGEGRYVDRARDMLDRSMSFVGSPGIRPNSLYKGDVGIALLEAELAEPFLSAMPLFESEGWSAD